MYKKIKSENKYRKCPICGEIIHIYDIYHIEKCRDAVNEVLKELQKGAKTNDTKH
jgi:transcription initiation factor IIE alpha subunit